MTMKIFLFLFLLHTCFRLSAQEIETSGFVESFNKKTFGASTIKIRTPQKNIELNYDKLDKETQKRLTDPSAKKIKQTFKYNKAAVIKESNPPMGLRNDCSEMPVSMGEIEDIAKNSTDMVDFLKKIPEGSLQGFTFVTNSLSLHRGQKDANGEGQVSSMWPRVLRTSMDGKTTVSFVCDPKNPSYGKVEIINFDDKEKAFKTTEIDFGHPTGAKVAPADRVHKDPVSCISCHAGSEVNGKAGLKPNWPEYYQWSDCKSDRNIQMYGGNDDNMEQGQYRKNGLYSRQDDCSNEDFRSSTEREQTDYLKFREKQKNNACFNSLPWPDQTRDEGSVEAQNWTHKYYPYMASSLKVGSDPSDPKNVEGILNISMRSNLRLTFTYSYLMAQKIAADLRKNPNYNAVKYALAMEQAGCEIDKSLYQQMKDLLSLKGDDPDAQSIEVNTPWTKAFADKSGLKNSDWNMEFNDKYKNKADYNSAIPGNTSNLKITDAVGGEILKDLSQSNPIFANADQEMISKGAQKAFGAKYSCIDELGGGIDPKMDSKKFGNGKLCALLAKENEKALKNYKEAQVVCENCNKVDTPKVSKDLSDSLEVIVSKLTTEQIARGKKLVEADSKGKCVTCHSASVDLLPKDFRFIPSEKDANKAESVAIIRARKDEIAKKIENRLIKNKTMPPMENELTDQDRQDVKAYLLSIAAGK
ncbi:c-type cytochrome [Bacteriovorax sp. PP10]|uniref:C-type cytochrome n=1 Tax=Bacteriovorax antarcticus TaxID=3088717 RepID=A0ABU5VTT4_9BACT|nr:c-type cytochrome [Bacteriovorax sp. PP10]MEA9356463.1 c-type cytochrome [Bacteriovorax sp. PP10]